MACFFVIGTLLSVTLLTTTTATAITTHDIIHRHLQQFQQHENRIISSSTLLLRRQRHQRHERHYYHYHQDPRRRHYHTTTAINDGDSIWVLYSQLSQQQLAQNIQKEYLNPLLQEAKNNNVLLIKNNNNDNNNITIEKLSELGFANNVFKIIVNNNNNFNNINNNNNNSPIPSKQQQQKPPTIWIAKIFSDLAKKRLDPKQQYMGEIDEFLYQYNNNKIGPCIVAKTEDALLMEYIDGKVLTESMIYDNDHIDDNYSNNNINDDDDDDNRGLLICQAVGDTLAKMHTLRDYTKRQHYENQNHNKDINTSRGPNMLWHAMDVLLSSIDNKCHVTTDQGNVWNLSMLQDTINTYRQRLETLNLPEVLGHGDLKLSNIILTNDGDNNNNNVIDNNNPIITRTTTTTTPTNVRFIDFELTGTHYRGYDLAKFFRTSSNKNQQSKGSTKPNNNQRPYKLAFWKSYYRRVLANDDNVNDNIQASQYYFSNPTNMNDSLSQLEWEAQLLEPMTWLEASAFFLSMATVDDPSQKDKWMGMAKERLTSFEKMNKVTIKRK